MGQPYELVSVRRTKHPPGVEGANWNRYVIAFEGSNSIQGYRQGNLRAVTRQLEEIVTQSNERHLFDLGCVDLVLPRLHR